ncbi:Solute carrier family 13 member 3 [Halotydeus destructor]|nr:Solute carrier family 13 member 3 [Halotydeus destructor]
MTSFNSTDRSLWRVPWQRLVLFGTPVFLLPLLLCDFGADNVEPMRCAYVVCIMAVYWALELVPVAVTGLLPIILLPLLSLARPDVASRAYFREENLLFLCCLMIAIAVENSNVHRRVALKILMSVGTNYKWLLLSFMFTTAIFGILINNSAATAMMIPIADAVLEQVYPETTISTISDNQVAIDVNGGEQKSKPKAKSRNADTIVANNKKCLYLGIAYAATIGTTTSLTSNGPNLVMKRNLDEFGEGVPVDYLSWMLVCTPATIVTIVAVWLALRALYCRSVPGSNESKEAAAAKKAIAAKYAELGDITFHEASTLLLLFTLVFLWMFRSPSFMAGWTELFCDPGAEPMAPKMLTNVSDMSLDSTEAEYTNETYLEAKEEWLERKRHCSDWKPKDSTAAMTILMVMFFVPVRPFTSCKRTLVEWPAVQNRLAWGLLMMRGGGFSIADAVETSQLSAKLSSFVTSFESVDTLTLMFIFICFAAVLTEFLSNTATTLILLPIAKDICIDKGVNPLVLMICIVQTCSLAFVLPVGTPPNALVFAHRNFKTSEMVVPGLLVKLVSAITMLAGTLLTAYPMYKLSKPRPDWLLAYIATNHTLT